MAMTPKSPAAQPQNPANAPGPAISPAQGTAPGGAAAPKTETPGQVPIWFFIGALLLLYGLIITGAGIYQFWHPPHTVLAKDHASFWGGLALILLGGGFTLGFWPGRKKKPSAPGEDRGMGTSQGS